VNNEDLTAVYYTSNAEDPVFEQRIGETLMEAAGDTPIISVSQKPMAIGRNICVGSVGASSQNAYVQMLIGLEAATTKWVCTACADGLYPPEYFQFVPPREDVFYFAKPLWVFFALGGKKRCFVNKPLGSEVAMVCNRRLLIERVRTILEPIGGSWGPHGSGEQCWPQLIDRSVVQRERFHLPHMCITVKTDNQMHRKTPCRVSTQTDEVPYWGTVKQFTERMFQ
jgi:hypothetical protein